MTENTKRVAVTLPLADIEAAQSEAEARGVSREKVLSEKFSIADEFSGKTFELVDLAQIEANPYQPRERIDFDSIAGLARGLVIKRKTLPDTCGLMQLPMGRWVGDKFQLAFGHRRFLAFNHNNATGAEGDWTAMPVIPVELSDEDMFDFAARENSDREQINDIEKAVSIQRAVDEFGWTQQRAGSAHGLSKSATSNLLKLLKLPDDVQQLIAEGALGQRHGRELARLMKAEPPMPHECRLLADGAIRHDFTVDEVSKRVDDVIRRVESERRQAEARALLRIPRPDDLPEADSPAPDVESTAIAPLEIAPDDFGIRWCPACGDHTKFAVHKLQEAYRTSTVLACPKCQQPWAVMSWLRERPEAKPPPSARIVLNGGQRERRADLRERLSNLGKIIDECSTDCLHRLETWFEQIEAEFPKENSLIAIFAKETTHEQSTQPSSVE